MRHVIPPGQNVPGVLAHISGMDGFPRHNIRFAGGGETEDPNLSRMTSWWLATTGFGAGPQELEKIVTVVRVDDISSQDQSSGIDADQGLRPGRAQTLGNP